MTFFWGYVCSILVPLLIIQRRVTGSEMTISPSTVTLNAATNLNQTMRCTWGSEYSASILHTLILLKINFYHSDRKITYASISGSNSAVLGTGGSAQNALSRLLATASGQITDTSDTHLTLAWNTSLVVCSDAGVYECEISFLDTSLNTQSSKDNSSLTVQKISLNLVLSKNGVQQTGATESSPLEMLEGQMVNMSCTGEIGSNGAINIDWYHIGTDMSFQKFSPGLDDVLDYGQPSTSECGYERTTTLLYTITDQDIERDRLLGFMCAFQYTEYGVTKEITTRKVYIKPRRSMELPSNVMVDLLENHLVKISWTSPPVDRMFILQLGVDNSTWMNISVAVRSSKISHSTILAGLARDTTFFLQMLTLTQLGETGLTDVISFKTKDSPDSTGIPVSALECSGNTVLVAVIAVLGTTSGILLIAVVLLILRKQLPSKGSNNSNQIQTTRRREYMNEVIEVPSSTGGTLTDQSRQENNVQHTIMYGVHTQPGVLSQSNAEVQDEQHQYERLPEYETLRIKTESARTYEQLHME